MASLGGTYQCKMISILFDNGVCLWKYLDMFYKIHVCEQVHWSSFFMNDSDTAQPNCDSKLNELVVKMSLTTILHAHIQQPRLILCRIQLLPAKVLT